MKKITICLVFILAFIDLGYTQLPSNPWVIGSNFSQADMSKQDFPNEYLKVKEVVESFLNNSERNTFATKRDYESIIKLHIDTSLTEQIKDSYEWLENDYEDYRSKYIASLNEARLLIKKIDEVYFRFENTGNLLTGRASVLITGNDNKKYIIIFKTLCKVNEQWMPVDIIKIKEFEG